jgi:hypothetical protein
MEVKLALHSKGPNETEIFTVEACYPSFLIKEWVNFPEISHCFREVTPDGVARQVQDNPAMPVLWPKAHGKMQGSEVFDSTLSLEHQWEDCRDGVLSFTRNLKEQGLSKQLTNRLLEPWVMTTDVMTFTREGIESFLKLRHPHAKIGHRDYAGPPENTPPLQTRWEDKVNLTFPAEYNIQQLAIEMKAAMDASNPTELEEGQWHLPFVEQKELESAVIFDGSGRIAYDPLIKLSAARCAFTNDSKSIEQDLDGAAFLTKEHRWSPFEHQAQMIDDEAELDLFRGYMEHDLSGKMSKGPAPSKGLTLRIDPADGHWNLVSRNFNGCIQARALLEEKS